MTVRRRLAVLCVVLAAVLPYLPTLDDYFVQDDFGVVWLLSAKPAGYFPRWFISPWMDDIWGDPPDEIRPFPAVTYQVAALPGAGSPVANHAINIGFHAINAWLVLRIGETAAGLSLGPAAFAAIVFATLPMHPESVAWVTGRVDSMPACFYLLSFLLYDRWRALGRASLYIWSVIACFVALFTKQNAVTLPATLMLYDAIVARHRVRLSWNWMRPYVPFVALTGGYLALRFVLFGEVARESSLNEVRLNLFLDNVSIHLKRMVFGEAGLALSGVNAVVRVCAGAALVGVAAAFAREYARRMIRPAVYFLIVWVALGIAPTLVAGYGSPRHMYLASVGWTLFLGLALAIFLHGRPGPLSWTMKAAGGILASAVVVAYASQLRAEVDLWGIRSAVSQRVVHDLEREIMAAQRGSLLLVDPPQRSWNFALPFALRPPFTREDLSRQVLIVSHSSIHCCASNYWEPHTRRTLRTWLDDPARPPVIALRWDQDTGTLFRLSDADDPFLRTVVATLLDTPDVTTLDRLILNITRGMVVKEVER